MNRRLQLALIALVVTVITAAASHAAMRWLKISASYGRSQHYGPEGQEAVAVLHCSSLGYSGVDWGRVSERVGGRVLSWGAPGSSPAEWEVLRHRSPSVPQTFIVLSPYDLNEYILCDFRAEIVPLGQAIGDLRRVGADWPFCKRILSQYPVVLIRKLFPTVGRSDGVMTGIRDWLQAMMQRPGSARSSERVGFATSDESLLRQRLSDWFPARLQRRLVLMRSACQGRHAFNGPKKMALTRLVEQAGHQGAVTLVVVPVSPTYQKEFLTSKVREEFEAALAELKQLCPRARLVRLDQLPTLWDNGLFSDIVHLNLYGRQIATAAFFNQLDTSQP